MTRHEKLFQSYLAELHEVHSFVQAWWAQCLEKELMGGLQEAEAGRKLSRRWPMGPASHPRVIEVYRRYYLLCEELNEKIEKRDEKTEVDPENSSLWGSDEVDEVAREEYPIETFEFLIDWLVEEYEELHLFVSSLVFEPIGNENG